MPRSSLVFGLVLTAAIALAGCGEAADTGEPTVVSLAFFDESVWDGTEVVVDGVPGVVGVDDEILVAPPIVGDSFDVIVRQGDAEFAGTVLFRAELDSIGVRPRDAVTESIAVALGRNQNGPDDGCVLTWTNHVVANTVIASEWLVDYGPCGPFLEP